MDGDQTLLEFIDNDIKHYKEILICNKDDEHIQTYYTRRLNYYNKLKEVVTIYNAIITKPYKPLKEKEQDYTLEEDNKRLKSNIEFLKAMIKMQDETIKVYKDKYNELKEKNHV